MKMINFSRKTFIFIITLGLMLAACQALGAQTTPTPDAGLALQDCILSTENLPLRLDARCGTLRVYEDRAAGSGRQIELFVAVLPALSRNPQPDPLFFLAGGPGQAASESYLLLSSTFETLNQERDIVLVDQRGTGRSAPLACPQIEDNAYAGLSEEDAFVAELQDCLAELQGNPALYTTTTAMQDLDDVRAALGYETLNLYGVSYGTRAALTYLRLFPQRVRSLVLDGVVPPQEILGENVAQDAQRAIDLIFARCAADPQCAAAFPNVEQEFQALMDDLRAQPASVQMTDPVSGQEIEFTLTWQKLANAVRLLSYTQETVALLPLLIHTAQAEGDLAPLAAQYSIASSDLQSSISDALNISVLCAEDVPFFDPAAIAQANAGTYLGDLQTQQLIDACRIWPRGQAPADFRQPFTSQVPALLLSGQADPVTPPENAALTAQTLTNSLQLVAPGQGHNVIFRGCLPRLVTDFIEAGSFDGLNTACVNQIEPLPFFLNFNGPVPAAAAAPGTP